MKILPSLASADQMYLGETIQMLKDYPYLHFDIEDGNFVPNITFGMKTIRAAAALCKARMDAHLMVVNPYDYFKPLADTGFAAVSFHWEATGYPLRHINRIHELGMDAGIAINPCTSVTEIFPYLDRIEYVLVMTSEPDGKGEMFQDNMIEKIQDFAERTDNRVHIIADGGIGEREFDCVKKAGATAVVMGRTIFRSDNPLSVIKKFVE